MKRLSSFLMGMLFGAALLYGAQHYHVVYADDGHHLISKLSPSLTDTYVDIREFTFADWTDHPELATALMNADRRDLVEGAASDALQNGIDNLLGSGESEVR